MKKPTPQPKQQPKPIQRQMVAPVKKSKISFLTLFLGFIITLMSLLTLWVLVYNHIQKKQTVQAEITGPQTTEQRIIERERIIDNPAYLTKAEAEDRFGKIENDLGSLENRFKTWSYRSWITAVVTNENAMLAHEVDRRYHPQYQPDYLKLSKDWKVNRMPELQGLTEEQREEILRGDPK